MLPRCSPHFIRSCQALAYAGRRRLQIGYPGYAALTRDERQILILIALAQRDDPMRLDAHLQIIGLAARRPALAVTVALSAQLSMNITCKCHYRGRTRSRLLRSGI